LAKVLIKKREKEMENIKRKMDEYNKELEISINKFEIEIIKRMNMAGRFDNYKKWELKLLKKYYKKIDRKLAEGK